MLRLLLMHIQGNGFNWQFYEGKTQQLQFGEGIAGSDAAQEDVSVAIHYGNTYII